MKVELSSELQVLIRKQSERTQRMQGEIAELRTKEGRTIDNLASLLGRQSAEDQAIRKEARQFKEEIVSACGQLLKEVNDHKRTLRKLKKKLGELRSVCEHDPDDDSEYCLICTARL